MEAEALSGACRSALDLATKLGGTLSAGRITIGGYILRTRAGTLRVLVRKGLAEIVGERPLTVKLTGAVR